MVRGLKNFHSYLYGQEVILRTDNAAVSWMKSLKNPTGQVARWLQFLETYNLKVTHRPGYQHRNADDLSRNPCKPCKRQEENNQTSDDSSDERIILLIQTMMPVLFVIPQKAKYQEQSLDSISNLQDSKKIS